MRNKVKAALSAGALTVGLLGALAPATVSQAHVRPGGVIVICDYTVNVDQAYVYSKPDVDSTPIRTVHRGDMVQGQNGYVTGNGGPFRTTGWGLIQSSKVDQSNCF